MLSENPLQPVYNAFVVVDDCVKVTLRFSPSC